MDTLYQESFAPWCEKARWALDHHGIRYRRIEHRPLLGEPALRWAARRARGRVTVPLLVTRDARLGDSLSIAQWADRVGAGEPLFPPALASEVDVWNRRSETLMEAGRALLLPRLLTSDRALREQPPAVRADSAARGNAARGGDGRAASDAEVWDRRGPGGSP